MLVKGALASYIINGRKLHHREPYSTQFDLKIIFDVIENVELCLNTRKRLAVATYSIYAGPYNPKHSVICNMLKTNWETQRYVSYGVLYMYLIQKHKQYTWHSEDLFQDPPLIKLAWTM